MSFISRDKIEQTLILKEKYLGFNRVKKISSSTYPKTTL